MSKIVINGVEVVTMRQAAELANTSYERIAWLVQRGELDFVRPGGREKFIPVQSLRKFLPEKHAKTQGI